MPSDLRLPDLSRPFYKWSDGLLDDVGEMEMGNRGRLPIYVEIGDAYLFIDSRRCCS